MASKIIGRTTCPECGDAKAHVKESEKCIYRYCGECGSQYHAKTELQRKLLLGKMRPPDSLAASTSTPEPAPVAKPEPPTPREPTPTQDKPPVSDPTPTPTPTPEPVAKPKRRGLFGG